MHQNRGINRTFVPIIVRVGLTLPVFPSVYYQHRIIRRTTPGQNRYAMTFQELNLIEPLKRAVAEKGYTTPTPIQQQAIPPALEGRDLLGCAQTGTGKTAAFTLPILQLLSARPRTKGRRSIKALVLTPTRELAIQIDECCRDYARYTDIRHCVIFGGVNQRPQVDALQRGIDLLVATPGRLLDLIGQGYVSLSDIRFFVLDEADRMLDMGFIHDIRRILPLLPEKRQTLFFSATMPERIIRLSKTYMRDTEIVRVEHKQITADLTEQIYFEVREADKFDALTRIIDVEPEFYGIIFARTKIGADETASRLTARGYAAEVLHGDVSQAQREKILRKFRDRTINILVATDVAARGIDVGNLTHVINYSLPQDSESYVHRIGRTGRAGKQGTAITFVSPSEFRGLNNLMRDIKVEIKRETLPSPQDIVEMKRLKIKEEMQEIVENESYDGYKEFAEELLAEYTPDIALGALLRLAFRSELDQNNYPEIRSFSVDRKGTARLFLAVGKRDGYTARKLVDMLKFKCGLRDKYINDVQISDNFSFVSVPFRDAEEVVRKLNRLNRGRRPMAEIARDGENGAQEAPVRKPRRTKTEDYQTAGQTYAPAPKKPARNVKPATPVPATPAAYDPAPAHDETVHAEPSHDQTAYDQTSSPRRKLKTKTQPHPDIPDFSKMSNEGFDWSAFMKFDEGTAWGRDENGKGKGKATKSVRKTPKKAVTAAQRVAAKGRKRK